MSKAGEIRVHSKPFFSRDCTIEAGYVGNTERGGESVFLSIRALVNLQLLSVFVQ